MKTKNLLILILCSVLYGTTTAQTTGPKDILYVYRTEADFFNKIKSYRGEYLGSPNTNKLIYKPEGAKKEQKLNLNDSSTYFFGYEHIGHRNINTNYTNPKFNGYMLFGGGNKDAYFTISAQWGNYGKDGYLTDYSAIDGWVYMYFVDRVNNLTDVSLEEFLKSKPKLLEQYRAEKKETNKKVWERNQVTIAIKYLKLFNGEEQ